MREFKTFEEQIEILKKRHLLIHDEKVVKDILMSDNYYNIINGYKKLFIIHDLDGSEIFRNGSSFEEIYALFNFDREIRAITFDTILKFENVIKTQVAYTFSKYHNSDNYLIYENFETFKAANYPDKTISSRASEIYGLISNIQNEIRKNIGKKEYVYHYIMHDGNVPLWVLVNCLSLGTISKFYSLIYQLERSEISKYWGILENELNLFLQVLAYFRNLCAHDERVYCGKYRGSIPDTDIHKELNISRNDEGYASGKNDLFALMIIFKKLLNNESFINYFNKVNGRIISLSKKLTSIPIEIILAEMGFPENWYEIKKI